MNNWKFSSTLLAMLLCISLGQAQGSIGGTVSGQDLTGTVVLACWRVAEGCDQARSAAAPIGPGGVYRLDNLGTGPYMIVAWRDLNRSGQLDAGDEAAVYTKDGKAPTLLNPPQQKIDLRLRAYDGTDASLLSPPTASAPSSASPVGAWTLTSGGTTVISYNLKSDGTYIYTARVEFTLQSGCNRAGVYTPPYSLTYITGTYRIEGQKITFIPRTGTYTSDTNCTKTERPTSPENMQAKTYTWRVREDPGSVFLYLGDADGERVYWK